MTKGVLPTAPVMPAGRSLDPRGIRVSVVGAELEGPPPIIVEPGAPDTANAPPTIDGVPVVAFLESFVKDRATLLEGPDGPAHRLLLLPGAPAGVALRAGVTRREVIVDGWRIEVDIESAARAALQDRARRGREEAGRSGPTQVHAIIPGVVVNVSVTAGDAVTAGQQLLVVEAMKMQNELRAPRDGTIERVAVGAGATIEVGDLLLVLA